MLPPNFRDVTAEKVGTVMAIVGATALKPETGPGPAAPTARRGPPTAEATKAAQQAGIVSIGPRRDRYGSDSRWIAALRRMD